VKNCSVNDRKTPREGLKNTGKRNTREEKVQKEK
jgi:hypothetical protein